MNSFVEDPTRSIGRVALVRSLNFTQTGDSERFSILSVFLWMLLENVTDMQIFCRVFRRRTKRVLRVMGFSTATIGRTDGIS